MPIENLSGKAISDTYQRVVQTDGTYLADGTGSLINNLTIPGNLIISGTLYAQNTVILTQSYSSGSNILGDAADDFQTLYGTVRIPTGSLTITGSVIATSFTGSLFGTASYTPTLQQVTDSGTTTTNRITTNGFTSNELSDITYFNDAEDDGLVLDNTNMGSDSVTNLGLAASSEYLGGLAAIPSTYASSAKRKLVSLVSYGENRAGIIANWDTNGAAQDILFSTYGSFITPQLQIKGNTNNLLVNTNTDTGEKFQVSGSGKFLGTLNVTGSTTVKGTGTTSATTALTIQDSNGDNSFKVADSNVVTVGRTSTFTVANTALYIGHRTNAQFATSLVLDPNKDENTIYKLVLQANFSSASPFQLYSSGVQTWLSGYANPMFAQGPAMRIPAQISMGTADIGKSEISGSVLFIHGADFYARAAYTRYTSYTTGVRTLRGAATGFWTGDTFRVWNYENTSIDLGVNNIQRLQVTPTGINITGSINTTGNLTLGSYGKISSGDFANPAGNNAIAMGYSTIAAGNGSIVTGFISDTDSGTDFNAAIGYEARAYLPGQISFAYGNHVFNNRDAGAQQSFLTVKNSAGLTTGATMDLSIAGTNITLLGASRAWMVTMDWIATVSSISGTATGVTYCDTAGGTIRAVVKKVGGVLSVVGIIANDKVADTSLTSVAMTFVAGGGANLIPRFTGPTFAGGGTVTMRVVGGIKLAETVM